MSQPGTQTCCFAIVFKRTGWGGNKAPKQAEYHQCKDQDANAFVQFGCTVIPGVVIAQPDHPQTKNKKTIDGQSYHPMNYYLYMSEPDRLVSPQHPISL